MDVLLAKPRGFCAGVDRAIEIVERALDIFGAPIYVRHEVVHNQFVVDYLKKNGAIFVDELDEVPLDTTVIFSAHGVSQSIREQAKARNLRVFDATCPLVTKVHLEVAKYCKSEHEVILIGHEGHPEVEGTMGQYHSAGHKQIYLVESPKDVASLQVNNPDKLAFVTQTTLSMDDTKSIIEHLQARFPNIIGPKKDDICYATQNRQDAVKALAKTCDVVLVVGSVNSSNSNRLKEIAIKLGKPAYLIDGADDINKDWIESAQSVGVTAGASAPEVLVHQVLGQLKDWGAHVVNEQDGIEENVVFRVPKELQKQP